MEVQHQIDKATGVSRSEGLTTSENDNVDRVSLVVMYHPDLPHLSKIFLDYLPTPYISGKNEERYTEPTPHGQLTTQEF